MKDRVEALEAAVAGHSDKLQFVSVSGTEMYVTGANLNIRNGLGVTNGNPADPETSVTTSVFANGLGNLVIGYNEIVSLGPVTRTGSHNIDVGPAHPYPSVGGL